MKFCMGAKNGLKTTWFKFEMATAPQLMPRTFRRGPLLFLDFLKHPIAAKFSYDHTRRVQKISF